MRWLFALVVLAAAAVGAEPVGPMCAGGITVGRFELMVRSSPRATPIPLKSINQLRQGFLISYEKTPGREDKLSGELSLVIVPEIVKEGDPSFIVLPPRPVKGSIEWTLPVTTSIVAVVYGPRGLDEGKVKSLVRGDQQIISQLAEYAEKTQKAEELLLALSRPRVESAANLDAAIHGFVASSATPQFNRFAPPEQQYQALFGALNPALSSYDPLAGTSSQQWAQTASLAAVVAGLFFGQTVGLAAGGAALLNNLRTIAFPNTEFRSAFAQPNVAPLTLCGKREPARSRTKLAYIWATRIPQTGPPVIDFAKGGHVPLTDHPLVEVRVIPSEWPLVGRVTHWTLRNAAGKTIPVVVSPRKEQNALEVDFTGERVVPGTYQVTGKWDWNEVTLSTPLQVHAYPDLSSTRLSAASQARLVAKRGKVALQLEGSDFEFVERLTWIKAGDKFAQPQTLPFLLPSGKQGGPQSTLESEWDVSQLDAGDYRLTLAQSNGKSQDVAVKLLTGQPEIENLPLRLAVGEKRQRLLLRGTQLERIQGLMSDGIRFELGEVSKDGREREVMAIPDKELEEGKSLDLALRVQEVGSPVPLGKQLVVSGTRPSVTEVKPALPKDLPIELFDGEIPAGIFVGFQIRIRHAAAAPIARIRCVERSLTLQSLELRSGESKEPGRLQVGAAGQIFLSLDPGQIGAVGCHLFALIESPAEGQVERVTLGKVVKLPGIATFEMTDQPAGEGAFAGQLKGQDLELIERTGWDAEHGLSVSDLPTPIAGEGQRQQLRVALSWPSPTPRASLYLWLRGDDRGRRSSFHN